MDDREKAAVLDSFAALEKIKKNCSLDKLYFIKVMGAMAVFGARGKNNDPIDLSKAGQELANLLEALEIKLTVRILTSAKDEVELLLTTEVNKYVDSHGGYISVTSIDEEKGLVLLNLQGACSGCPSSVATLKVGIERILQGFLPWVQDVDSDQPPVEPDFGFGDYDLGGQQ